MASEVVPRPQYIPPPRVQRDPSKPKQTINRRKREGMDRDAEYLAIRDCYLEDNPFCDNCGHKAYWVHHICSGVAGKDVSRRNPNTWLGYCDIYCHEAMERMTFAQQVALKVKSVKETIARLRT